jgi:hypothetical protein
MRSKIKLNRISENKQEHLPDILKKLQDHTSGIMYFPGDQLKEIIKKDKESKKLLINTKETRDVSHLKDKLKRPVSKIPINLPTNIEYLKAIIENSNDLITPINKGSSPMTCIHKQCVERIISNKSINKLKPSSSTQNSSSLTSQPTREFFFENEILTGPSGLQESQSLSEWFKKMKKSCSDEESKEIVYAICAKELLRQVSVHCNIRGKILKDVLEYQPYIFNQKLKKNLKEFATQKQQQQNYTQKIIEDYQKQLESKEKLINDLQNSLEKTQEVKNHLEDILMKYRISLSALQQKSSELEIVWRKRAWDYMKELNRIKGIFYTGTDKLSKFFAREDAKMFKIDEQTKELLTEINNEKNRLFEYQISLDEELDDFKKFQDKFIEELEDMENANQSIIKPLISGQKYIKNFETLQKKYQPKDQILKPEQLKNPYKKIELPQDFIDKVDRIDLLDEKNFSKEVIKGDHEMENKTDQPKNYYFLEEISIMDFGSNLANEIDEVPSNEEESKSISNIYSENLSPDDIMKMRLVRDCANKEIQTDNDLYQPYNPQTNTIQNLFDYICSEESKVTINNLQNLTKNTKSSLLKDYELCKSPFKTSSFDLKTFLSDIIANYNDLSTLCNEKQIKISKLDQQIDDKIHLLNLLNDKSISNKIDSKNYIESPEKSPVEAVTREKNTKKKSFPSNYDLNSMLDDRGINQSKITNLASIINSYEENTEPIKDILDTQGVDIHENIHENVRIKRKTNKSSTKVREFNFHAPIHSPEKKKANPGPSILEKFLSQPMSKIKQASAMSRKNVNKLLTNIYIESYERLRTEGKVNLIEVTYEDFSTRYALKSTSDKKFLKFIGSIISNSEYKRCWMYLKLINSSHLVQSSSYSNDSVHLYINSFQFLINSGIGLSSEDDKIMIPLPRAVECIKDKFESILDKNTFSDIVAQIEQKALLDPKRSRLVEMETVLEIALDAYEVYVQTICTRKEE